MDKETIKKNLDSSINEIILKYFDLIEEYIENFKKNIKIMNVSNKIFIFNKGLNCIIVIYNILLINTNNLNFVYYTTKKGIYYYLEFIEQTLSKNNVNLNLSTSDAVLFVYKKTINNIKPNITVNKIHNKIKVLLELYNFFLTENIKEPQFISKNTICCIKKMITDICKLKSIKKIITISNYLITKNNDLSKSIVYIKQNTT